ncbi:MAG: site-specific DNA-methyltransferase [Synechococcus sp. SB0678_bin_12]|nr:site-specific DNA-methyltransferase [Synechococcus sp. SB0678_bin_12]
MDLGTCGKVVSKSKLISAEWAIPIVNTSAKERTGYPTQKPLALLDRIIKASSNPGDLVLDPFCGCATALVAADRLGRQWAGIDLSPLATKLVKERIMSDNPLWAGPVALDTPPKRTDWAICPTTAPIVITSTGSRKASVWAAIPTSPSR